MRSSFILVVSILLLAGCSSDPSKTQEAGKPTDTAALSLPDTDAAAAGQCWVAIGIKERKGEVFSIETMSKIYYLSAVVARDTPGDKPFPDKIADVTNQNPENESYIRSNADALARLCKARFTKLDSAPSELPEDGFDRAMRCYLASNLLIGSMQGADQVNYPEKARLNAVANAAQSYFSDDRLKAKGISSTEGFAKARIEATRDATLAGRLDLIAAQCPDS